MTKPECVKRNPCDAAMAVVQISSSPSICKYIGQRPFRTARSVKGSVLLILATILLFVHSVGASVIYVPSQQPTIQAGINAAGNGDTVLVASGTYTGPGNFDISTLGKRILLRSEAGPDFTTLLLEHSEVENDRGFEITDGEDSTTTIEGFSITSSPGIWGSARGGAVRCYYSSPRFVNCIFSFQRTVSGPGAILAEHSSARFEDCTFSQNVAGNSAFFARPTYADPAVGGNGGAASAESSDLSFVRCLFSGNVADAGSGGAVRSNASFITYDSCRFENNTATGHDQGGVGGAIHGNGLFRDCEFLNNDAMWSGGAVYGDATFVRCTFIRNSTYYADVNGGGAFYGNGVISSCTFAGNVADIGSSIYSGGELLISNSVFSYGIDKASESDSGRVDPCIVGVVSISCTDIFGNGTGDWIGTLAPFADTSGNFSNNPLFCDTSAGDYHIATESPCNGMNNVCNQQIGALSIGCSLGPTVTTVSLENEILTNVVSTVPKIIWEMSDRTSSPQDSFDVEVGTDDNWQDIETWNPVSIASADTFVTYSGAELVEGQTYFLRLRVHNSIAWSSWYQISFHMNSATMAPSLNSPPQPDNGPIFTMLPTFTWFSPNDLEQADNVHFKLEVAGLADFSDELVYDSLMTTSFSLQDSLQFGRQYWWRVTVKDATGFSAMSAVKEFWTWKLGDISHSNSIDLTDLVLLVAYLTRHPGPDISPKRVADLTGDCQIDLSDLSLMISYMTMIGVNLQIGCE
jgi:hypothetical protein